MKKFLVVLVMAIMVFSFVACENKTPTPAEQKIKVTLVYSNGTADKVEEVVKGSEYTLPAAPVKEGNNFTGWFDGKTTFKAGDKVKVEAAVTFTAMFEEVAPPVPEATKVATIDELNKALADETVKAIMLTADINGNVKVTRAVTIDLNGKTVKANSGNAFVVSSGAKVTLTGNGTVKAASCAVLAIGGSEVTVENGTYEGKFGLAAGLVGENSATRDKGTIIVNDAKVKSSEFALPVWGDSKLVVNGGTFTATDNAVIGTNGNKWLSDVNYDITVNGGTFNGNITTPGYIACGIYMANTGKVTLNGGEFNIIGGIGVLVRSGELTASKATINLMPKEELTIGKVGDSLVQLTTGSQIVVDASASYPGAVPSIAKNDTGYTPKTPDGSDYSAK